MFGNYLVGRPTQLIFISDMNMNDKDHLVGQLTSNYWSLVSCIIDIFWLKSHSWVKCPSICRCALCISGAGKHLWLWWSADCSHLMKSKLGSAGSSLFDADAARWINQIFNFAPICIDSSMGGAQITLLSGTNSVSQYCFAETIWKHKQFLKKHTRVSQYSFAKVVWKEVRLRNKKNLCVCKTIIYSRLLPKLVKERYLQ